MRPFQIFFILFHLSFIASLSAQIQQAAFHQPVSKNFLQRQVINRNARAQQCGIDTAYYAYAKATSLLGLNINTVSSADRAGQWFDAPQQMMLHGFTFFAWVSSVTTDSVTLTCRVILAGSDSLPTGPVVATTTVKVDTAFSGGSLAVLEKTAMFSSPVYIDYPYVLVVETSSPLNVALVTSDWDSLDGAGEWLGMASIVPSGWLHGYDINVGGVTFDADFVFNPIVSYEIDPSFTTDTNCVINGGTVDFTNTTNSPVLQSRFYNQYVFNNTPQLIYTWDYDDGSPLDLLEDTVHTFAAGLDYNVVLRAAVAGWSSVCQKSYAEVINPSTTSDFSFAQTGLTIQFTNMSTGFEDSMVVWHFGDGITSADLNPAHTYTAEGNFEVSLITSGDCVSDTVTKTVSLCNPLSSDFTFEPAGLAVDFTVSTISGSASFLWDYGDGATGSGIASSHVYSTAGTYAACLIATNSCKSDTTCQPVTVIASGLANLEQNEWEVLNYTSGDEIVIRVDKNVDLIQVTLFDMMGKVVKNLSPSKTDNIRIDLAEIPAATYYLHVKSTTGRAGGKVITIF